MRQATLEEREHLVRLDKKMGGDRLKGSDFIDFLSALGNRKFRKGLPQQTVLSVLFNGPGATDLPEDRIKQCSRKLHDRGKEMPPDEVRDNLEIACHKIRKKMESLGYEMPESDVELLKILKDIL